MQWLLYLLILIFLGWIAKRMGERFFTSVSNEELLADSGRRQRVEDQDARWTRR